MGPREALDTSGGGSVCDTPTPLPSPTAAVRGASQCRWQSGAVPCGGRRGMAAATPPARYPPRGLIMARQECRLEPNPFSESLNQSSGAISPRTATPPQIGTCPFFCLPRDTLSGFVTGRNRYLASRNSDMSQFLCRRNRQDERGHTPTLSAGAAMTARIRFGMPGRRGQATSRETAKFFGM
jgi:hypothetical protein